MVVLLNEATRRVSNESSRFADLFKSHYGASNDNEAKPKAADISKPCLDPFTAKAAGGLIGDVATFTLDTSPSPIPEFAVLSAAVLAAAFFGRRFLTPDGLGLNLYVVMVAGSGFGKDRPIKVLKQLATVVKRKRLIGPNDFASDSALEYVLRHQPCLVLPMDEFGMVLSASGRMSDPYSRARRKALLELYSSATSDWVAKVRAGDAGKDNKPPRPAIEWPTLSILAGTTPETFYEGLEDDAFGSGLMARLLVISVDKPPVLNQVDGFPAVPPELVERLDEYLAAIPGSNAATDNAAQDATVRPYGYTTVAWQDSTAVERLKEIRTWARNIGIANERRGLVVNRAGDFTSKLATLRAISRNPANAAVTFDDVEWGFAIVLRSIQTIEDGAERFMAGSPFESLCKSILEAVRKCRNLKGLKNAELLRAPGVRLAEPRMFEAALRRLLDGTGELVNHGEAKLGQGGKGGRYRLAAGVHQ